FVVTGGRTATPQNFRDFLEQQLPTYMLPTRFHLVASLPLTPNGKVDRKQLHIDDAALCHLGSSARTADCPAHEQLPAKPNPRLPSSRLEAELCEIWQAVFERDEISPTDDFFQLGGDSLTAIALAAKIQRRFGWNMTLAELILSPTIRQLAIRFEYEEDPDRGDGSVEINRGISGPPLFYVPPICGELFGMRELALRLPPEWTIVGLQPHGVHAGEKPERAIAAIASHYLEQVRRRQPQGPYHLVGFS